MKQEKRIKNSRGKHLGRAGENSVRSFQALAMLALALALALISCNDNGEISFGADGDADGEMGVMTLMGSSTDADNAFVINLGFQAVDGPSGLTANSLGFTVEKVLLPRAPACSASDQETLEAEAGAFHLPVIGDSLRLALVLPPDESFCQLGLQLSDSTMAFSLVAYTQRGRRLVVQSSIDSLVFLPMEENFRFSVGESSNWMASIDMDLLLSEDLLLGMNALDRDSRLNETLVLATEFDGSVRVDATHNPAYLPAVTYAISRAFTLYKDTNGNGKLDAGERSADNTVAHSKPGDPPPDLTGPCDELNPEICAGREDCHVIRGSLFDMEKMCHVENRDIGCMDAHIPCSDKPSWALDPDGACWSFGNDCLPAGFTYASQVEGGEACRGMGGWPECTEGPLPCADLDVSACAGRDDCSVIRGSLYDMEKMCHVENRDVGCMDADGVCGQAGTAAIDPEGACWSFRNTCLPSGFNRASQVEGGEACSNMSGWPVCTEETLPCADLDVSACNTREECSLIMGQQIFIDDACIGPEIAVGCKGPGSVCVDDGVNALDPDGACWAFFSGCVPKGWGEGHSEEDRASCDRMDAFQLADCPSAPTDCAEVDPEVCSGREDCVVITGNAIDRDNGCIGASSDLGCMQRDWGCGDAETYARDPEGVCWWFSSTCQPSYPGWESAEDEDCGYLAVPNDFCE